MNETVNLESRTPCWHVDPQIYFIGYRTKSAVDMPNGARAGSQGADVAQRARPLEAKARRACRGWRKPSMISLFRKKFILTMMKNNL
jgi:hypothetical protein